MHWSQRIVLKGFECGGRGNERCVRWKAAAGGVLALVAAFVCGCGGSRHATRQHPSALRSTITVSGTTTIVETLNSHITTTPSSSATRKSRTDYASSGYYACRNLPPSYVRAAQHSRRVRTRLLGTVVQMLKSTAPGPAEFRLMLVGCLRALNLRALPKASNA